jgi:hypothetical protein
MKLVGVLDRSSSLKIEEDIMKLRIEYDKLASDYFQVK